MRRRTRPRIEIRTLSFVQRLSDPDKLWEGLLGGTVRTAPLVLGQTAGTQVRIRRAFDRLLDEYVADGGIELPVSVKLASGWKAR